MWGSKHHDRKFTVPSMRHLSSVTDDFHPEAYILRLSKLVGIENMSQNFHNAVTGGMTMYSILYFQEKVYLTRGQVLKYLWSGTKLKLNLENKLVKLRRKKMCAQYIPIKFISCRNKNFALNLNICFTIMKWLNYSSYYWIVLSVLTNECSTLGVSMLWHKGWSPAFANKSNEFFR